MVAAWISALTGVGPAMASGSQTYSGIWADLPQAPMNRQMQAAFSSVVSAAAIAPALLSSPVYSSVPKCQKIRNMPIMKPKSPMRLATKAFLPAMALLRSLYQKPISR